MTNAELAVLSLVAECPRHGYDIERAIQERGMREWTDIGFSSIYYLLGKLEKAGLLEVRADSPGERGPARKVYWATDEGYYALRIAIADALASPATNSPFALALGNLAALSPKEVASALHARLAQLRERLAGVRAKHEQQVRLEWFVDELFDFSSMMLEAEITWVEGLIGRVEARGGVDQHAEDEGERAAHR